MTAETRCMLGSRLWAAMLRRVTEHWQLLLHRKSDTTCGGRVEARVAPAQFSSFRDRSFSRNGF